MFQRTIVLFIMSLATSQSAAFTLPAAPLHATSKIQSSSCVSSSTPSTRLAMAVCDVDSSLLVNSDMNAYKIHRSRHAYSSELDDAFEKWTLQLFDDSTNTRSHVCRSLVELAGLLEEDSYRKMMQAHENGESTIGEYCHEHAEHYKEALASNGLNCEIFPLGE